MSNTESLLLAERKQLEEMIAETSDEREIEKGSLQARLRVVNRDLFFVREVARRNAELNKQPNMYGRQSEKGKTMFDLRRLLVIKANLETVMQRDLETSVRVYAEQQLDAVCKEIEEAREEFGKLFEPQEIDQLKQRVAELEASNAELLDVLEDFVIDVEGYFGFSETDDMEPEDDVAYFIGEYCRAKRLIKKARVQG